MSEPARSRMPDGVVRSVQLLTRALDRSESAQLSERDAYAALLQLVLHTIHESHHKARLPSGAPGPPGVAELHRALAAAQRGTGPAAGGPALPVGDRWQQFLAAIESGGSLSESSPHWPLASTLRLGDAELLRLLDALLGDTDASSGSLDVTSLGRSYELLLAYELRRLSGAAIRLRKLEAWLEPSDLLAEPPAERAKWLRREYGLSKNQVSAFAEPLRAARVAGDVRRTLASICHPPEHDRPHWELIRSQRRRQSGAHYTPEALCRAVIERCCGTLELGSSQHILALRVCDPAMGAGAFLLEACRYLSERLVSAWCEEGRQEERETLLAEARRMVATNCLYGLDKNSVAVALARASLSLLVAAPGRRETFPGTNLLQGDALVGPLAEPESSNDTAGSLKGFDWKAAFPSVFGRKPPGFDVVIGNPPWIAYVGRATQPLNREYFRYYSRNYAAFRRYRTLHGVFVERAAQLLRSGGRLGLVLPTSVSDLAGYAPTRAAHDALCETDAELLDFGDGAFDSVFQPCMALVSTRRSEATAGSGAGRWRLARSDLCGSSRALLERLERLPCLPEKLFGERGFQTQGGDLAFLRRLPAAQAPFTEPIREGTDIVEYVAHRPATFLDRSQVAGRFRDPSEWRSVKLLIRQTARFPIAAPSDGLPFRNSILAGFETEDFEAPLLLCLLNANLTRWFHFTRHRDARQGMPQLKIGHLRSLPAPPHLSAEPRRMLTRIGETVTAARQPPDSETRRTIDAIVAAAFALSRGEQQLVAEWAARNPPPIPRRRGASSPNRVDQP